MNAALGDLARLHHIIEALDYIDSFLTNKTKEDFFDEPMLRFAIERQLEIIGEAANHISTETLNQAPNIEWRKIVAFRNFIVHEYFGLDLELLWGIIDTKLHPLRVSVEFLIRQH
jgi:uncharacterized protein with HEPN domain